MKHWLSLGATEHEARVAARVLTGRTEWSWLTNGHQWTEAQASAVRHESRIREFVAFLPAGFQTVGEKEVRHALRTSVERTSNQVDDLELVLGTVRGSWFEFSVRVHETRQLLYHAQVNQGGMRVRMIW